MKKENIIAIRDELKKILLQFHESRMEGKGFDFFFVLATRVDELNKRINSK